MNIRPIHFDDEFPVVKDWWRRRGTPELPAAAFFSAQGFVVEDTGLMIAVTWLYVVPGTRGGIGILEFTTTNPAVADKRLVLESVKRLYAEVEAKAWEQGCGSMISFVAPGKGEQHLFDRCGWRDLTGGQPHLLYGKERPPCP